jgi:pimeloyl-ACP methyl ester carboxylesterase
MNHLLRIPRFFSGLVAVLLAALPCAGLQDAGGKQDAGEITPFKLNVEDAVLRDLKERLARARFPDQIEGAAWNYGVELNYLKALVAYWRDKYDWRAHEAKLNAIPQFTTTIDGVKLHFLHQRSKEQNALPLVIVHGWPGSVYEFHKVIGPLTDPVAHGGKAEDAFHVVCPSLPGFGFSERPKTPGYSVSKMSDLIAKLMARLGYKRYGAQGGDWGANVATWLGSYDSAQVAGVHLNFISGSPPSKDDPWKGVTPAERARVEKRQQELKNHYAYSAIQGTRPQTIGYALNDSPVGLAAWITDRFWAWSDHRGNLENSFSKDELLTNIMIYWVTETPASSARIYYEREFHTGGRKAGKVPVGVALFPKEINVPPRRWAETRYNLVHWTEMPRGGHFAALEETGLFVEDVRTFFRKVR